MISAISHHQSSPLKMNAIEKTMKTSSWSDHFFATPAPFSDLSQREKQVAIQKKISKIDSWYEYILFNDSFDKKMMRSILGPGLLFNSVFSATLGTCILSPAFETALLKALASIGIIAIPSAAPLGIGIFLILISIVLLGMSIAILSSPRWSEHQLNNHIKELKEWIKSSPEHLSFLETLDPFKGIFVIYPRNSQDEQKMVLEKENFYKELRNSITAAIRA